MKFLLTLFILTVSSVSLAWGPKGQEITVQISEKFLSPQAKIKINKITKNASLSSFATWADQARNSPEWKQTAGWHYINVDDQGNYDHSSEASPDEVLNAISYCVKNFKSETSDDKKLIWLKFIIHFVGDIHQPMHIGRVEDRGGNSTQVQYGRQMNLHYLWDTGLLDKRGYSVSQYVSALQSQNRPTDMLNVSFDANKVIAENFALRKFIYSFSNGTINKDYEKQGLQIVDDRLWVGGLRLASLLNEITK